MNLRRGRGPARRDWLLNQSPSEIRISKVALQDHLLTLLFWRKIAPTGEVFCFQNSFFFEVTSTRPVNGQIEDHLQTGTEPVNGELTEAENILKQVSSVDISPLSRKRKASELPEESLDSKRLKGSDTLAHHETLCAPPGGSFSIFLKEDFRDHLCRCPACYLVLRQYPTSRGRGCI